jgi:hypothetical protein
LAEKLKVVVVFAAVIRVLILFAEALAVSAGSPRKCAVTK